MIYFIILFSVLGMIYSWFAYRCLDTQFALLVAEGMLRFVETDRLSAAHLGAAMLDPTLNELI
jgi:hypothetical protein